MNFVLSDKSPLLAHLPSGNCDTTDSSKKIEAQKILTACTVTMRYIDDGHATTTGNPYLQCLITIHKYTWAFTVSTHAASTYGILALEDEALSVNFPEWKTYMGDKATCRSYISHAAVIKLLCRAGSAVLNGSLGCCLRTDTAELHQIAIWLC